MPEAARRSNDLGDFIRSRRAAAQPPGDGRPSAAGRRRVPGLRREEVAASAGVSLGYYVRLEQGRAGRVSETILGAVARALGLDPAETAHLLALAHPSHTATDERHVPAHVQAVVLALDHLPALVLGPANDIVCWNRPAHALLAGHLPYRLAADPAHPLNWAELLFLDARVRDLFVHWPEKAADTVADLRTMSGRHPGDRRVRAVVRRLCEQSPPFRHLWESHTVASCDTHVREYRHPLVGDLRLADALFVVPDTTQRLVVFTADPASAPALARLRDIASCAGSTAG